MIRDILKLLSGGADTVERIDSRIRQTIEELEYKMDRAMHSVKRQIIRSVFEVLLISAGILLFASGMILLFTRFFPLDAVLIVAGIILLFIVSILHWLD